MPCNSFATLFYQLTPIMIFILYTENTHPLKLLQLRVPDFALMGARARLSCLWQLDDEEMLYSVKWYKDGMEFFRYVPGDRESHKKFSIPGVDVWLFDSTGSNITLAPAVLETEGRYRCEVSGERPLFLTVSDYADMAVVALPNDGPFLNGIGRQYKIGETVTGNCTSGASRQSITLAWYIDGVPAEATTIISSSSRKYPYGLQISVLGLKLKLTDKYLSSNCLKIKCISTIPSLYWKSNETCIILTSKIIQNRERMTRGEVKFNSYSRTSSLFFNFDWSFFCIFSVLAIIHVLKLNYNIIL